MSRTYVIRAVHPKTEIVSPQRRSRNLMPMTVLTHLTFGAWGRSPPPPPPPPPPPDMVVPALVAVVVFWVLPLLFLFYRPSLLRIGSWLCGAAAAVILLKECIEQHVDPPRAFDSRSVRAVVALASV
eukprot:1541590-Prymnesium_polylepis.1